LVILDTTFILLLTWFPKILYFNLCDAEMQSCRVEDRVILVLMWQACGIGEPEVIFNLEKVVNMDHFEGMVVIYLWDSGICFFLRIYFHNPISCLRFVMNSSHNFFFSY
jgi:hypothetical protein